MSKHTCDMTLWAAIQSGDVRAVADQLHPRDQRDPEAQQLRNRSSFAPREASPDDAGTAGVVDSDYDGAPFCSHCGAKGAQWCDCGPLAE